MKTNEVTKQPKEIKAEISVEIISEDKPKPTKHEKRNERWGVAAVYSLIVLLVALACALFMGLNIVLLVISSASFLVFFVSLCYSDGTSKGGGYDEDCAAPCDCLHFDDGSGF